jgi:mannose-6-phosphate isomerase
MHIPPLVFEPILQPRIWGGRWLCNLGKRIPADQTIGESWEIADIPGSPPGELSVIASEPFKGMPLRQLLQREPHAIMGDAPLWQAAQSSERHAATNETGQGVFPLLIKYLDAQQNLSVQVHPDDVFVSQNPDAHLKSEAWVIIHAQPGAVIYKGIKPGVTPSEFRRHIAANTLIDDLVAIPVSVGECHYLPSGTCHALGAGVVVAEVQTPSDTTFRVYDWGRADAGRALHIDQAMQCIRFDQHAHAPGSRPQRPIDYNNLRITQLTSCEYFSIERIDANDAGVLEIVTNNQPQVWMVISGRVSIQDARHQTDLAVGTTALIPAALQNASAMIERGSWVLRITLPSSIARMIA